MLKPAIEPPPLKLRPQLPRDNQVLVIMMGEYAAIRAEITTTLTCQVQILSFGAATVGLLSAAAAALWSGEDKVLACLLLLFGIPLVCFLTLTVYSGEMIRLMRAGLFMNRLENCINEAQKTDTNSNGPGTALTWEQWRNIRHRMKDVDKLNRFAIYIVFVTLAVGFNVAGNFQLRTVPDISRDLATTLAAASGVLGIVSVLWLAYLYVFAYEYRTQYVYTNNDREEAASNQDFPPAVPALGNRTAS